MASQDMFYDDSPEDEQYMDQDYTPEQASQMSNSNDEKMEDKLEVECLCEEVGLTFAGFVQLYKLELDSLKKNTKYSAFKHAYTESFEEFYNIKGGRNYIYFTVLTKMTLIMF